MQILCNGYHRSELYTKQPPYPCVLLIMVSGLSATQSTVLMIQLIIPKTLYFTHVKIGNILINYTHT